VEDPDALGFGSLRDQLAFVLGSPRRHKLLALTSFVSVAALAAVVVWAMPHSYEVQASILAQRNPVMGTLTNPGMNREWDAPARAAREVVIRRENLIALSRNVHLLERYLATRAPAIRARDWVVERVTRRPPDEARLLEDLLDTLAEKLWVVASPEGLVTIGLVWSDRELAYQIVQAAVQTFLDERHASEIKAVGETIAILQVHDATVQRDVAQTVDRVDAQERALGIRSLPPVRLPRPSAAVPDEEATRLETRLAARRRALSDLEAFRQQRLADLQAQLVREQTVYAPSHPTLMSTLQAVESFSKPSPQMLALRAEADELERQLAARGGAAAGLATAPELAADATLRLHEGADPRLEPERRRLDDLLRQHANLLERIEAARVEMDTAQAAFKYRYSVVAPPLLPQKAVRPYELLAIVGGLLGGLAMAFFASAAADLRSGRVLEPWQLERTLLLPVIGELPR